MHWCFVDDGCSDYETFTLTAGHSGSGTYWNSAAWKTTHNDVTSATECQTLCNNAYNELGAIVFSTLHLKIYVIFREELVILKLMPLKTHMSEPQLVKFRKGVLRTMDVGTLHIKASHGEETV